ncbi:MAG: hypothetical protein KVP17_001565 [Porospora cf. gigantea B]|nr:MAG: hypothetical protein KVP17_001565 [Porospora cf. gigantea B]
MSGVDGATNSTMNVNNWKRHRSTLVMEPSLSDITQPIDLEQQSAMSLVRVKSQATLSPTPVQQSVGLTVPPYSPSPTSESGLSGFVANVPAPGNVDVRRERLTSNTTPVLSRASQSPACVSFHPECLIFPDGTHSDISQTPELHMSQRRVNVHLLHQRQYISTELLWLTSDGFSSPATVDPDMRLLVFRHGSWVPVGNVEYTYDQNDDVQLQATYMHVMSRPRLFAVSAAERGLRLRPVSDLRNDPGVSRPSAGHSAGGKESQTVRTPNCIARSGVLNTEEADDIVPKYGAGFVVMNPEHQKRYLTELNIVRSNFRMLRSGTGLHARCHDGKDVPIVGVKIAEEGLKCSLLLRLQTDGVLAAFDSNTMTWTPLGDWISDSSGTKCRVRIDGDSSSSIDFTISSSDNVQVDFTTIDLRYNQEGAFGPLPQFSSLSHSGLHDWGFHEFVNIDRLALGQCSGFHDPLVGENGKISVRKLHLDHVLSAQAPFDILRTRVVVDSSESNMNMFFITTDDHEVYQVFPLAGSKTSETTWLAAQGQVLLEIVRQPSGDYSYAYFDDIDVAETQSVRSAPPDYHNGHFPGLTIITKRFKLTCDHSGFWCVHDRFA